MWKKALWVYLGLYVIAVVAVLVNYIVKNIGADGFSWASCLVYLLLYFPPAMLVLELRGRRTPMLLVIVSVLILAVPIIAILNFNEMSLMTIGKVLPFAPMLAGLIYYGQRRLLKKKVPMQPA